MGFPLFPCSPVPLFPCSCREGLARVSRGSREFGVFAGGKGVAFLVRPVDALVCGPSIDVQKPPAVDGVASDLSALAKFLQPSRDCREGLARVVLEGEQVGPNQPLIVAADSVVIDVRPETDE